MSEGVAVILGALIGGAFSFAGSYLVSERKSKQETDKFKISYYKERIHTLKLYIHSHSRLGAKYKSLQKNVEANVWLESTHELFDGIKTFIGLYPEVFASLMEKETEFSKKIKSISIDSKTPGFPVEDDMHDFNEKFDSFIREEIRNSEYELEKIMKL